MANNTDIATKVKDVVCGKEIDPKMAQNTSNYNGQTYYFCSDMCKKEFDESPDMFVI